MVGVVVFGTTDVLLQKYLDRTTVEFNGMTGLYYHPFVQTLWMFFGQSMCLAVYYLRQHNNLKEVEFGEQKQ
jgi:drug/metabolite transporter (DMT)-like permease